MQKVLAHLLNRHNFSEHLWCYNDVQSVHNFSQCVYFITAQHTHLDAGQRLWLGNFQERLVHWINACGWSFKGRPIKAWWTWSLSHTQTSDWKSLIYDTLNLPWERSKMNKWIRNSFTWNLHWHYNMDSQMLIDLEELYLSYPKKCSLECIHYIKPIYIK